jgi:hypothetical protein
MPGHSWPSFCASLVGLVQRGGEEVFLAAEVVREHAGRDAGLAGDLAGRDAGDAGARDHPPGGRHEFLPALIMINCLWQSRSSLVLRLASNGGPAGLRGVRRGVSSEGLP